MDWAARLGGSFEQRLLHVHPALDRLIDRAPEVSPAAEAHRDLIGEVPAVPAIEEVVDGLIAAPVLFVIPAIATAHA